MTDADTRTPVGQRHHFSGALLVRRRVFWTPTDNHDPHRTQANGTLEQWERADGSTTLTVTGMGEVRDAHHAVYLIDDGATVTPWYVAGWSPGNDAIHLHAMPVNVNPDGTPRMRADHPDRPVDYATWALGPRRAFHLKVTGETRA